MGQVSGYNLLEFVTNETFPLIHKDTLKSQYHLLSFLPGILSLFTSQISVP